MNDAANVIFFYTNRRLSWGDSTVGWIVFDVFYIILVQGGEFFYLAFYIYYLDCAVCHGAGGEGEAGLSVPDKKETGRSLAQYMLEKGVEKAKKLLQSDMSVKNVALQTGYSNFSYFSKVFRDVEGMSPMEYRGKIRKR